MPRQATTKLTAARVRSAPPGRYGDGNGLYLLVRSEKIRSWIFRYVIAGKMREMGLGPAHGPSDRAAVSLVQAREKAAELIKSVRNGDDPLASRAAGKAAAAAAAQAAAIARITFKTVAGQYIEAHEASWKNAKHAAQWTATLVAYAYPYFGEVPIADIETAHVVSALDPIWRVKPETASRVRGRIEAILDYARVRDYRAGENPARWRGHLDQLLPARSKIARVRHHAALRWADLPAFMVELRAQSGVSARALEFLILTVARTTEALGAPWAEVDRAVKIWTVPSGRMKGGREHRVPLSAPALAMLDEMVSLKTEDREDLPIFPGAKPGCPLSQMALLMTLRRMGRDTLTVHGFRSTFRDWAAERTSFPADVAEMALAHAVDDKTEAAYRRGELLEKRRRLADAWAKFCTSAPAATGGNVREIRAAVR